MILRSEPVSGSEPDPESGRWQAAALVAVGLILGGLLVGYEPVGGDPDRIFRPIKAELSRSLGEGRLPFWSDRLGLGVPLVAESHVGAFYPPNWLLYRVLKVSTAYRLSMWLHIMAIAAGTFAYSRHLGNTSAGSALAAIAFPFCGFLTIHSSHEWAYQNLAYLPLCLLAADKYAESGNLAGLATLALLWGVQITLGHFQVQMWTGGLALAAGGWRIVAERLPLRRIFGLAIGLGWGMSVAALQLLPTWELAKLVGQTDRSFGELAYYSYPPGHWPELVIPSLFRNLEGGGEAPYWFTQQTTGFEACLFIGTIPMLLAIVGSLAGGRRLTPWRFLVPLSFAVATLPRWWPQGYAYLLQVPGLGYFRCPARYTAVSSFGLAMLAGRGLDATLPRWRFRIGMATALAVAIAGFAWSIHWVATQPELQIAIGGESEMLTRLGLAMVGWVMALGAVAFWRRTTGQRQRWGTIGLLGLTTLEMAAYYYAGGTTQWGWPVPLPESSPTLERLLKEPGTIRVGGVLDNLPVRAGLITATPYTGFPLLPPHPLLKGLQELRSLDDPLAGVWLRRYGVTHLVVDSPKANSFGKVIREGGDPALDVLTYRAQWEPNHRRWRIVALTDVFPMVRIARKAFQANHRNAMIEALSRTDARDEAWFLPGEAPNDANPSEPRANVTRIKRWEGLEGEIEHDGTCDLIFQKAYYPGWVAKVNEAEAKPVHQADGGLIAVRLTGKGTSRVRLRFQPNGFNTSLAISTVAVAGAMVVLAWDRFRRSRKVL